MLVAYDSDGKPTARGSPGLSEKTVTTSPNCNVKVKVTYHGYNIL